MICTKCNLDKSPEEYNSDTRKVNGKRSECKSCQYLQQKKHRKDSPESRREYNHKYYVENSDKFKEAAKLWQARNPEKVKEIAKKSHRKHPETGKKADKKWRTTHPEKHAAYQRNRRALKRGAKGSISMKDTLGLFALYDYRCLRCGADGRKDVKLTLDHVVPLVLGGDNNLENAQPLCFSCNSIKNAKIIDYRFGLGE